MHTPIQIENLGFSFSHKQCFESFTSCIYPGSRIAIIGRNGSGKSTLLRVLQGDAEPTEGDIYLPDDLQVGYVSQVLASDSLSGSQRFNKALSKVLALSPNVLLLDEPSNHLDTDNRQSLIGMLQRYQGTLVVVSHDVGLLSQCVDILWHLDGGRIHEFCGSYSEYTQMLKKKHYSLNQTVAGLKRYKKNAHEELMREQKRAAGSKGRGKKSIQQRKWPTVVSHAKAGRAETTSGKKKASIDKKKQEAISQLSDIRTPEIIVPKFSLMGNTSGGENVVLIRGASLSYGDKVILDDVYLSVSRGERVAICGKNASGKSTLLKAILGHLSVLKTGEWYLPNQECMGYLDQHYSNLTEKTSVIDQLRYLKKEWSESEAKRHLNDFLFRKKEELDQPVRSLSGGEKARFSLALIAAKVPSLLVLDEITNNIDLETKEHVIQVLKDFPGAIIIVSHDTSFLEAVGCDSKYQISRGRMRMIE